MSKHTTPNEESTLDPTFFTAHNLILTDNSTNIQQAKLLLQDNTVPEYCRFLALADYKLGEFVESRRILREFLQIYPDDPQASALLIEVEESIKQDARSALGTFAVVSLGIAAVAVIASVFKRR